MKQTNSAIKFLLAQYRAIFKNANLKMFLAATTAAVALTAGAANAAPGDNVEPTPSFTNELKDSALNAGENIAHSGAGFIVLDAPAGQPIIINGGSISNYKDAAIGQGHIFTANDIILNSGSISIHKPAGDWGLVGRHDDASGFTAGLRVNGGKLENSGSFIWMTDVTLAGGTTTMGGYTNTWRTNDFEKYSMMFSTGGPLTITGDAVVNMEAASGMFGKNVNINGGTINFKGEGKVVTDTSASGSGAFIRTGVMGRKDTLSINNGTINVEASKHGGLYGDYIVMNGGTVNVKDGGTLTLGNNLYIPNDASEISLNAGTINVGTGSTLVIEGNAKLADGVLKNKGSVAFSAIPDGQTRSLTISANEFNNNFFKETTAGISASGTASGKREEFNFNVEGGPVDLVKSKFVTDAGVLNSNVVFDTTVKGSLVTENATLSADSYSGNAVLNIGNLTAGKSGTFTVKSGSSIEIRNSLTVTPKDDTADLTVNGVLSLIGKGGSVNANKLVLNTDAGSDAALNVQDGTWNVKSLNITSGSANVTGKNTRLNLTGTLTTTQTNGIMYVDNGAIVDASSGVLKLAEGGVDLKSGSTLILDKSDVFSISNGIVTLTTGAADDASSFAKDAVASDHSSILKIKNAGNLEFNDLHSIRDAIASSGAGKFQGFLNFEGAQINGAPTGDVELSDAKFAQNIDGIYNNAAIKTDGTVDKSFSAAQIKLTGAATTAAIGTEKTVMLNGRKGSFIVKDGETTPADASVASGAALVLAGTGSIGAINGTASDPGVVLVGHSSLGYGTVNAKAIGDSNAIDSLDIIGSTLNVEGVVKTGSLDLIGGSSLNITAKAGSGSITTKSLDVEKGASINAAHQAITLGSSGAADRSSINGNVTAKSISVAGSGTISVAGNATVSVESLDFGAGTLSVGNEDFEENGSATVITKSLAGTGKLFIDPVYGEKAALVIADELTSPGTPTSKDAGTLAGSAVVGNNAALGIGFTSEEQLMGVIGKFLDSNGSFERWPKSDNELANALVLNKRITINTGKGITLQKDTTTATNPSANSFTLGSGTGIVITDNVFDVNPTTGEKSGTAIKFGTSGTVTADGGEVILVGKFDTTDELQIFDTVTSITKNISVRSANGLLNGTIASGSTSGTAPTGKTSKLAFEEDDARAMFAGVSAPVQNLLIDTLNGKYKTKKGLGTDFVYTVAGTSLTGVELDAALHAATYAGAQQAAVAAVGTMAEAVAGRVGSTGVETTVLAATGSEGNGGVWITPMYKSVNSDGFNAQGASYGADVDLAGVTLGVDSVRGNMRFGAAFNIGSGDADGKGNGNGLKDDFDYYGFGIYTAMDFTNCSLIADASVNVISHDVEGYSGHKEFGTLSASADTTAVTLGLTGQYTLVTEVADVTPHVGMRFTRLDTDSYDLNSAKGVLANTDFDVQNVFSIPVGVTLSKTFEHNGWVYAPAADFTLTFNTGDTEVDSTTHLNDMTNLSLNTEVLDEVTYGLNLGFSAQSGSFGTSVNVSYAGSENTDSVGINANARYMF